MDKPRECPFCGGEAVPHDGYPKALVVCRNCSGRTMGDTLSEAIAAWNRRADEHE